MMSTPRVSIGLPVYNGAAYLEATLESILAQTYSDFELTICDNASTDATPDICLRFEQQDCRVRYHRNPKNLGVAPNYNTAFALSSGEYFKWADYDDVLAPEFLERCVETLDTHPDVAVCFPRSVIIDENGQKVQEYDPLPDTASIRAHHRFRNLIMEPDHFAIQASGLMRAAAIRKTVMHGSYPSSDEVFLASVALQGNFYEIPERLIYVRRHPKQSTKGILASERARVLFFDTSLQGQPVLVKWRYLAGALTAVQTAPIGQRQRLMCYGHMLRWLTVPKNARSLTKDMLLAIHGQLPIFGRLHQEAIDAANQLEV